MCIARVPPERPAKRTAHRVFFAIVQGPVKVYNMSKLLHAHPTVRRLADCPGPLTTGGGSVKSKLLAYLASAAQDRGEADPQGLIADSRFLYKTLEVMIANDGTLQVRGCCH